MKQISIPLEPKVASAFLNAKPRERKKTEHLINIWLKNLFMNKATAKRELFKTMDRASAMAQENGLTPEILERLLNEKD